MDPASTSIITTLVLILGASLLGGILALKLKQPLLLGYISTGVLLGNLFPQYANEEFIRLIADTGIVLLLFTLGIEFSFRRLRRIFHIIAWAAIVQIIVCITVFLLVFLMSGLSFISAMFIAVAASLSSTAVVLKYLSEKGEVDTVHGEALTGWLVMQDLAVIPLMVLLPAIVAVTKNQEATVFTAIWVIAVSLFRSAISFGLILLFGRKIIPRILRVSVGMKNREVFLLCVVSIVFFVACVSYMLGFSAALGAFIAGLLIADTSQNHSIFAEIRPLRDIFAVVFFVSLGLVLPFSYVMQQIPQLVGFTITLFVIKWIVMYGLSRYVGYHAKATFLIATSMTQISEFGFVIAREGVVQGALSEDRYVFLVALTFFSILISAPLMSQANRLYPVYQQVFKKKKSLSGSLPIPVSNDNEFNLNNHVILCGYGRVGKYIGRACDLSSIPYVVVDYNHTVVQELREHGKNVIFGDPAERDVLKFAHVEQAYHLVIAIPDLHTQEMIIAHALTLNKRIAITCRTHFEEDQGTLKSLGVHSIVQPEFEAALSIIERMLPTMGITDSTLDGKIRRLKIEHGMA